MNKIKGSVALIILAFSWLSLYWITGSRTPWNDLSILKNEDGVSIYLGDIPAANYDRMGFSKAIVEYIEREDAWLVGTERGEVTLYDGTGHQLWKRSLGIGSITTACVSGNGKLAFIGESSPEGNLYALDVHNGNILWKYRASDFIGSDTSVRSHPSIVHIVHDADDTIYANMYRFVTLQDGSRGYQAKMLAINNKGQLLWQFPQHEAIDCWINWCDVNDINGKVVISSSAYEYREGMKYKDTLYFIDKQTGALLNSVFVPAIAPYNNTVMRGSPNFSVDGKYLAAACSDGRGMLFDSQGEILWTRSVSKPGQVDGAWINASGRDAFVTPYGVLFTTINTFNRENWQLPTPIEHPSSNSIFLFGLDGSYKYQYQSLGTMEYLDFTNQYVACAIGRNVRTHNYAAHGAIVFDLLKGEPKANFSTEGPVQAIAISTDGTRVAAVEVPAVLPEGKLLGSHRLHIWQIGVDD